MTQPIDRSTIYLDAYTYDQIHSRRESGKDLEFYRNLAKSGAEVLEIACGTGRLTIPMAKAGLAMTGLDLSNPMLDEARRKAGSEIKINWVHGDCTKFELNKKFGLIFMTGNSIQHLHSRTQVIELFNCVNTHLEKDGTFAFDLFLPDPRILSRDSSKSYPVSKYKNTEGIEVSLDEKNMYDPISQVNRIKWYHSDASGKLLKEDTLEMRQFFPQELDVLLELGGFKILRRYGSWVSALTTP